MSLVSLSGVTGGGTEKTDESGDRCGKNSDMALGINL